MDDLLAHRHTDRGTRNLTTAVLRIYLLWNDFRLR